MGIFFLFWLIFSAACDFFYKKCFNWVAISGAALAFLSVLSRPELHPVSISAVDSLLGVFAGFFGLLIFYAIKLMGAGDVKFAAALGAWVGWQLLLPIWALSCGFAVLHGLVVKSNFKYFFAPVMEWSNEPSQEEKRFIPYVTYLSMATVIVLMTSK